MTTPEIKKRQSTPRAEHREGEPNQVVRVFLYQSRSVESIRDDEDLNTIHFTNLVLLKKGGSVNPGQLMPVGGRVQPGEPLAQAAARECVEETHLRTAKRSIRRVGTSQTYSFQHPKHGKVTNRVTYFKGKLSPPDLDIPYALDVEEDKIEEFVYLSPAESEQLLLHSGQVEKAGQRLFIQDALSPNAEQRAAIQTESNEFERIIVASEAYIHHLLTDARKKMMVIRAIYYHIPLDVLSAPGRRYVAAMRAARDNPSLQVESEWSIIWRRLTDLETNLKENAHDIIDDVNAYWRGHIRHFTIDDVRTGFAYSDFGAKLYGAFTYQHDAATGRFVPTYNLESGAGVPSVSLLLPLIVDERLRPDQQPDTQKMLMLASNPTGQRILRFLQLLRRDVIRRRAEQKAPASTAEIIAAAERRGLLTREFDQDYDMLASQLDTYFEKLRDAAGLTDADAPVDQLNEIKGADLITLIEYAGASTDELLHNEQLPRITELETARVLRWEARRKLVLLLLLNDAYTIQQRCEKLGIAPIQAIEQAVQHDPIFLPYARHLRIVSRPGDDVKDLMSLLRKIIVRDQTVGKVDTLEMARDMYANSYIFDDLPSEALAEQTVSVAPYSIMDANDQPIEPLRAPAVVVALIMSLLRAGKGSVSIERYKPLPPSGGRIESSGPGGKGDVRLFKFDIKHTAADGARYREVQGYVPDPATNRSGTDEYARKKQDDRRYGVQRLFDTKGTRSFMELLYPAAVYHGTDIRKMYKKRV